MLTRFEAPAKLEPLHCPAVLDSLSFHTTCLYSNHVCPTCLCHPENPKTEKDAKPKTKQKTKKSEAPPRQKTLLVRRDVVEVRVAHPAELDS